MSAEGISFLNLGEYVSVLQWGRALVSAEGLILAFVPARQFELQWGRALVSAEGAAPSAART